MKESTKKAIQFNRVIPNQKTSSSVETTFFILKQCSHRSLSTDNCNSASSLIMMISNFLDIEYLQVSITSKNSGVWQISKKKKSGDNKFSFRFAKNQFMKDSLRDSFFGDHPQLTPLLALNNLSVSCKYIEKLRTNLLNEATQLFEDRKNELDKIKTVIDNFKDTHKNFVALLTVSDQLLSSLPSIQSLKNHRNIFKRLCHVCNPELCL